MRTNAEEFAALGKLMGERLRVAKGPVRVLIPRDGWSALTGRKTYDLAGRETGSWAQPQADRVFVDALMRHLPPSAIKEMPHHINDAAFADACVDELISLLPAAGSRRSGR